MESREIHYGLEARREDPRGDWGLWLGDDPVLWAVPGLDGHHRQVHGSVGVCRQCAAELLRHPTGYLIRGGHPTVQVEIDGEPRILAYRGETRCFVDLGRDGLRVAKRRVRITVRPVEG